MGVFMLPKTGKFNDFFSPLDSVVIQKVKTVSM